VHVWFCSVWLRFFSSCLITREQCHYVTLSVTFDTLQYTFGLLFMSILLINWLKSYTAVHMGSGIRFTNEMFRITLSDFLNAFNLCIINQF